MKWTVLMNQSINIGFESPATTSISIIPIDYDIDAEDSKVLFID